LSQAKFPEKADGGVTLTTLVTGSTAAKREAAIAALLEPQLSTALILEGLPDGAAGSLGDSAHSAPRLVSRIAPGCLCCTGNLTMRVTLNRMLRKRPDRLFIALANSEHLEQIRVFLSQAPYDSLLQLTADLQT
jgi:G3E family GTPase